LIVLIRSGCFADEETPIQVNSGPNALIFMNASGNASTPTAMWNEIDYNPAPTSTLTESTYTTTYSVVNGLPTWARGSLVSSKVLLTNVTQSGTTPVFQYFAYQLAPGTDAGGNQYEILPDGTSPIPGTTTTVYNPLAPGATLSSAQAATAGESHQSEGILTTRGRPGAHCSLALRSRGRRKARSTFVRVGNPTWLIPIRDPAKRRASTSAGRRT